MLLADKIIALRRAKGWSQEELAEKLDVTRQSVSKWEGAQSTPDLERIVRMSELFGVCTDYLLKDEMEEAPETQAEQPKARRVTLREAEEFFAVKEKTAWPIAWATFACILSPIPLLLLGAMSEVSGMGISEEVATGVGLSFLLVVVAAAVAVFITCGGKTERFEFLEKVAIAPDSEVVQLAQNRQEEMRPWRTRINAVATCICILAVLPMFLCLMFTQEDLLMVCALCVTILMGASGVLLFIRAGILWESTEKLLQQGDYAPRAKQRRHGMGAISTAYWLIVTAVFLIWGFCGKGSWGWGKNWVIWPVAGVLYGALAALLSLLGPGKRKAE